ncbi:HEPN domain-containing protein [Cyclobacterium xiamenense]|uniref:HEPN domain-containing protein n=1 Tax=Cyclobacterium xiamenense TaxID=1297121 RepID=UPI0035D127A7
MSEIIKRIYENNNALIEYLDTMQQPSFRIEAELNFKKGLLLSIASLFEKEVTDILTEFVSKKSNTNELVVSFFNNKAIKRQYHTLFSWDSSNANSFFGLFGNDFKNKMKERVRSEERFERAIKSFLALGNLRNQLVHKNFAEFHIDKTAKELHDEFYEALYFIAELKNELENG